MGALSRAPRALTAAVLVVVLVASMALAAASSPNRSVATADAVGKASFAYLGGLRKFAAAVLWLRIDPILHEYYASETLAEQTYMVPTLYAVIRLDPQFVNAYYVASWIVARKAGDAQGIALAREGLRANPQSGLLHANLLQLLYLTDRDKHAEEVLELTEATIGSGVYWTDEEQFYEGLAVARDVLLWDGQTERAARVEAALHELRDSGVGEGDHDHDGDGEQDH